MSASPLVAPLALVFGGSFDPPTRAHVALPLWVANQVGAARVLFVPAGVSPHKLNRPPTSAVHRLAMLRLALADGPVSPVTPDISTVELERAGPSYTVDTLAHLVAHEPGWRFRLLIGSDQLQLFHLWHAWQRIAAIAEPLVMVRAPETPERILAALPPELPAVEWRSRLLTVPPMAISATDARAAAVVGSDLAPFVSPAVARYIHAHGLYGAAAKA